MSDNALKNIILCADGTGNKGGYTPDSNVYKTYNGVDIHNESIKQISYYDNGVGTSTNKIYKALSGAIGLGFKHNVRDLYEYLSMHYDEGDRVYMFGFSRGAATIRALLGFISNCGLVKGKGLTTEKLKEYTEDAFEAYEKIDSNPDEARKFREHKNSHNVIKIQFVGVWDTVSALGLPDKIDDMGLLSKIMGSMFSIFDHAINLLWSHHFYKYELTDNIQYACQALARDDARTTFWPKVWNENSLEVTKVEQVWFAGVHSNVGGGYERAGLSNVTLEWMLHRAKEHGLVFNPGFPEEQHQNANVNGRLYDSRDGVGIFYRYHPREIEKLCANKLKEKIKIHHTVFERLRYRTADYVTTHLPAELQIVHTGGKSKEVSFAEEKDWDISNAGVARFVAIRKTNYMIMLCFVVALVVFFIFSDAMTEEYIPEDSMLGKFISIVFDYTPPGLEFLVERTLLHSPFFTLTFIVSAVLLWLFNYYIVKKSIHFYGVKLRDVILLKIKNT